MDNTRNGEADCPRLRQGYVAQAGCGESAPQSAQARALKKAARALEESTVIVPYGQEATAKLPPNVISLATLQSLEREIERTEPDEGSRFTQPRFSEPSIARTDDSARAPFEQRHASPGTVGIQELTRAMGVDHGLETGPTAPRATWHANPLQSMLTPRPAQHYRLQMTPGSGCRFNQLNGSALDQKPEAVSLAYRLSQISFLYRTKLTGGRSPLQSLVLRRIRIRTAHTGWGCSAERRAKRKDVGGKFGCVTQ
ncbi:MAG: hypothetical protein IPK87_07025 [Planctomycetes bacterium]|nr:hypothetical protein [Planctomycetota bacterium]